MKTRLAIFIAALLLLPLSGLWLSGVEWSDLPHNVMSMSDMAEITNPPAILLTTLAMVGYFLLINHMVGLITGARPFQTQRHFYFWIGTSSAVLCWLLAYLNLYVASWTTQPENIVMQILLYTPLFALLVPSVMVTRALLGTFEGPLKQLSRTLPLPALRSEVSVFILLPLSLLGLLGSAAWHQQLFWLLWCTPLMLLGALQLLWGEGTIFTALRSGNWARVLFAALSGIIVSNVVMLAYQYNGGLLAIALDPLLVQAGYAGFGLLCLQLADVIAENWRGKQRHELNKKKPFPIPVVSRTTSHK